MVQLQQKVGLARPNLVTEGRDQGTIVFAHAGLKVYLTANAEERARRRMQQLQTNGQQVEYAHLLAQSRERDARDSGRAVGPLAIPAGAEVIDTTTLTQEQVTAKIVELAHARAAATELG